MLGWLRSRRRRKLLDRPFPEAWEELLAQNVWQYERLSAVHQAKLRDLLRVFIAEKNWEGCGGLELDDEMRVTVAGYASLLILELDPESYDHVISILIYPGDYFAPQRTERPGGLVVEEMSNRAGEAWPSGAVVLSWADVRSRGGGSNVVLHEFAHELDMLNHSIDGTPPLRDARRVREWYRVIRNEHECLAEQVRRKRPTLLNPYGATNPAELFAVATECFFERPAPLARRHPRLFDVLRDYYAQDPRATKGLKVESGPGAP
jgi:hypothetical protein